MAKKRSRFKFFSSMVDVSSWMDLKGVQRSGEGIVASAKRFQQSVPSSGLKETFEEAMARLDIDEKFLEKRKRQCYFTAWFYTGCGSALLLYAFYLLSTGYIVSSFVTYVMSALAYVFAYREGLWYYQMKIRKLGCSMTDFFAFITGRK